MGAGGTGGAGLGPGTLGGSPIAGTPVQGADPTQPNPNPTDPSNPTPPGGLSSNPIGSGQTFGGAGIIGFSPNSTRESILTWRKKNHFNEWEFVYDPLTDLANGGFSGAPIGGSPFPSQGGAPGTPPPVLVPTPQSPQP